MCYCKSIELYDEINEKKQYLLLNKNTNEAQTISAKRDKSNAFLLKDTKNFHLLDKFEAMSENSLISLPYQLKKVEYKDIVAKPYDFYRDFVSKGEPCLIKNIISDWPAFKNWQDNSYLIEKAGDTEFTIDITPDGYADSIKSSYFVQPLQQKMSLKKFFEEKSKENQVCYIQKQNNNLNDEFSVLKTDILPNVLEFFSEFFKKDPDASNLWIGTKESVTSLHKDNYENIFVVVKGEKHFTLIPPIYYPFMHPSYYKDSRWDWDNDKKSFVIKENKEENKIPWISINPDLDNDGGDLGVKI